jgi:hypothetical protein
MCFHSSWDVIAQVHLCEVVNHCYGLQNPSRTADGAKWALYPRLVDRIGFMPCDSLVM